MMCLLPSSASTHGSNAVPATFATGGNPDRVSEGLLFHSDESASPDSSPPTSDDDARPPPAATPGAAGWRRLIVHAQRGQWTVQYVSPEGQRFTTHDEVVVHLRAQGVDPESVHFLTRPRETVADANRSEMDSPEPKAPIIVALTNGAHLAEAGIAAEATVIPSGLLKVAFCNMRQNISDLRRKRSRKKSRDSLKRRNSVLSTASSPASTLAEEEDEPLEVETTGALEVETINALEVETIEALQVETIEAPPIKKIREILPIIPETDEGESLPTPSTTIHISRRTSRSSRCWSEGLESCLSDLENNDALLKTCFKEGDRMSPLSLSITHSDHIETQPSSTPDLGSEVEDFEEEICDYPSSEEDARSWRSEDPKEASEDLDGSFLSSFLKQIQSDKRYNCSIPMVDVFQKSPLDSFICYGCSTAYSRTDAFTVDFKAKTISITCRQCGWWTSRRILTQEYSF